MTTTTHNPDAWWTPEEPPVPQTPVAGPTEQASITDPPAPEGHAGNATSTQPPYVRSPSWARWALAALLGATALLYVWNLDINGWANSYYSAAAQAAGESWTAWFFGSVDAANSITVDKPPASLWLMGLSVRLFGLSSWSILVPQALLGVASVGVLFATVRRWFGPSAGLIAGTVLALTPVATLMFRFNNPDALLVFLLVCAAWAMGRATERGSVRWIMLAGAFVGFAFLAKMMQAFLVLPGFVLMYAIAAPIALRRRIGHLFAALAAMVVAGGWWVAVVELWPADSRPYIGGSQTNSIVELILGYNGFGRLTGNEVGSVAPGGSQRPAAWGETGWDRLFSSSYGGQVAWLLPAALVMIAVLLWTSRRAPRSDLTRAAAIGWGGWLLVTAAVISYSAGIIHEYYTVALAPAIGALLGIGCAALWANRAQTWARITSAALIAGTAWWADVLLGRSAQFLPWLGSLVMVCGLIVAGVILVAPLLPDGIGHRVAFGAGVAGLVVVLAAPAAYSMQTTTSAATGGLPFAGPAVARDAGGPGVGGPGAGGPRAGGPLAGGPGSGGQGGPGQLPGQAGGPLAGGPGQRPGGSGQLPGQAGGPLAGGPGGTGQAPGGARPQGPAGAGGGSLLESSTPGAALTAALLADAQDYTWVAAAVGAQSAAGYQLATEEPVMAVGGFNGSDPAPSLEEFQELVAAGSIHYFIGGGGFGGAQRGGSQAASEISTWVAQSFTATTIDGITLYDLTAPGSAPSTSGAAGSIPA